MFELTKDHDDFRHAVRDFAADKIAPHVAGWDRDHHFPSDLMPQMGELGLFGLVVPQEYGGAGLEHGGFTYLCLAIEELGRVDQSIGITLSAGVGLGINPILSYGTPQQKETFLPDLVAGRTLAGFGLTEPDAGSDAGASRTKATLADGSWTVNGAKAFITNSGTDRTSVVTVTARTGTAADGRPEISAIMVPVRHARLHGREALRQAGLAHLGHPRSFVRQLRWCRRITCSASGDRAFRQFLKILDDGRIAIAALALGCAQACLDLATDYAKTRTSFGRPDRGQPGGVLPAGRPRRRRSRRPGC